MNYTDYSHFYKLDNIVKESNKEFILEIINDALAKQRAEIVTKIKDLIKSWHLIDAEIVGSGFDEVLELIENYNEVKE